MAQADSAREINGVESLTSSCLGALLLLKAQEECQEERGNLMGPATHTAAKLLSCCLLILRPSWLASCLLPLKTTATISQ